MCPLALKAVRGSRVDDLADFQGGVLLDLTHPAILQVRAPECDGAKWSVRPSAIDRIFSFLRLHFSFMAASEQASRMRDRGAICRACSKPMDTPPWGQWAPQYCEGCEPTRRLYMGFFASGTPECSSVQFLLPDFKTPACRMRTFGSAEKIRELIARTPTKLRQEDKEALDYAIRGGGGGLWLEITKEQFRKLKG